MLGTLTGTGIVVSLVSGWVTWLCTRRVAWPFPVVLVIALPITLIIFVLVDNAYVASR